MWLAIILGAAVAGAVALLLWCRGAIAAADRRHQAALTEKQRVLSRLNTASTSAINELFGSLEVEGNAASRKQATLARRAQSQNDRAWSESRTSRRTSSDSGYRSSSSWSPSTYSDYGSSSSYSDYGSSSSYDSGSSCSSDSGYSGGGGCD